MQLARTDRSVVWMASALALCATWPATVRGQPEPDPLRASVSLSSDLVMHGLSQLQSAPSGRVAMDFEHRSGFFSGGSVANVEFEAEGNFAKPRDTQLTLYAGYLWRMSRWMTNVAASRYVYPGIARNYDYSELGVTVGYAERYYFTASRSGDYLALYDDAYNYRAGISVPWKWNLEFGANAGKFRSAGIFPVAYSYWDIGFSRPLGRIAVDLRFHDSTHDGYSLLGNATRDLWVLSLTHVFLPVASMPD